MKISSVLKVSAEIRMFEKAYLFEKLIHVVFATDAFDVDKSVIDGILSTLSLYESYQKNKATVCV